MHQVTPTAPARALLVTDFDGTMTRHDFYKLAAESLLPPEMPDYWARYREGRMTHFEALQAIFASIRADRRHGRWPSWTGWSSTRRLSAALDRLQGGGLGRGRGLGGLRLVHPDPAREGRRGSPGLLEPRSIRGRVGACSWSCPSASPFFSPTLGIDKAAVVRQGIAEGRRVAFAGDGFPDLDAAGWFPPSSASHAATSPTS